MSTSKYFNRICAAVTVLCLFVTVLMYFPSSVGIEAASKTLGYEERLFDNSYVHTIDIVMDDWNSFIESCENEEYAVCSAVIDGEAFKNIAIRAKGNTSLSQVAQYGNDRYSFKLEFDRYSDSLSYHGLDKLCLNNIIQDNTYMKDYLCYTMMSYAGAASPLCSFAYITVNGEDFGLYLAVEAIEDSFLERNYSSTGNLYKPDSMSMGGGRGNGKNFDQDDFNAAFNTEQTEDNTSNFLKGFENDRKQGGFGKGGGMGSDDVKLIYSDDSAESYSNIFDNAKTDITAADKTRLINSLKILNSDSAASTVDTNAVTKYFAVHNFVCNFDSYTGSMIHNYYLYENDGILSMIPWDYNLAFGSFMGGGNGTDIINYPIDSPVSGGDTDSRPMLAWIFANEEYTALYHEALSDFIADYFESGYFSEEFDRVSALIAPYVEKDPTKFCTYDEFTKGTSTLKQLCLLRAKSVRGQLDGSIPSTSQGQSSDSSALVDGSSVNMSDIGSMGGANNKGTFGNRTEGFTFDQNLAPPEMTNGEMPQDMPNGNMPPEMPNGNFPNGEAPPFQPNENTDNGENTTQSSDDGTASDSQNTFSAEQKNDFSTSDENAAPNRPQMPPSNTSSASSEGKNALMLCISAGVLIAALLLSKLFKDRI